MPKLIPYSAEEVLAVYESTHSVSDTAEQLQISRDTVYRKLRECGVDKKKDGTDLALGDRCDMNLGPEKGQVITRSRRIRTVTQALEYAEIDKRIWEVDRVQINSWEVGGKFGKKGHEKWDKCQLWQVKVTLKRRVPQYVADAIDLLVADFKKFKPLRSRPRAKRSRLNPHMLEVSLFDSHFGKFCWGKETGQDYDLKIAESIYFEAVEDLLEKTTSYNIDRIIYPIGNDFFHVNNWDNTTARGTPQDVDTRFQKVFDIGCRSIIHAIERCSQVAPVELIWVPGNHDPETSFYMAKVISAWFRANRDVTVDDGPKERKYVHYGTSLLGFTHGDEEKHSDLPTIMAGEVPDMWAGSSHREWHLGHFHKKKETRFSAGDTHTGVPVVVLPSLSGTDKWHYKKGYVNNRRAAVAYLWSHKYGYAAHFNSNAVA